MKNFYSFSRLKSATKFCFLGFLVFWLLIFSVSSAFAIFDEIEKSAVSRSMGGANVALPNNSYSIHYNPAGLSQIKKGEIATSFVRPFNYSYQAMTIGNGAVSIGKYGSVGLSYYNFGVKYEGVEMESEQMISMAHGFSLMNDLHSFLSFGYTLNVYMLSFGKSVGIKDPFTGAYIQQPRDLGSANTFGVNIGVLAGLWRQFKIGFYGKNLNSPKIGSTFPKDLPRSLSMGIAYEPYKGVISTVDVKKDLDADAQIHSGIDFSVIDYLSFRFGVQTNPNMLTTGVGANYANIFVDYGASFHPVLGRTDQIGLSYRF